ncbi:MAG: hypothetical protein H0X16_10790 [Chloroflexi bacterium]|nr:hypothetical protein [Chloroflexota bacterium]
MSRSAVSLIERGRLDELRFGTALRVAAALEVRLEVRARWRGGDLDRLLNAGHSALHESLARYLQALSGWVFAPEVSFAIYGERGIIDILAWHPGRRALLVIELKTDIVAFRSSSDGRPQTPACGSHRARARLGPARGQRLGDRRGYKDKLAACPAARRRPSCRISARWTHLAIMAARSCGPGRCPVLLDN